MEEAFNKSKNINLDDIQKKLSTYSISISKFSVLKFFIIVLFLILIFPRVWRIISPYALCFKRKERDDELSLSQQFEYDQENQQNLFSQNEEEELEFCDEPTLVYAGCFPA